MADHLAEQLGVARAAFSEDVQEARQFAKSQRPCYQMPSQLVIEAHTARCKSERSNTQPRARKTVVAAGTKHHSAVHWNTLEVAPLEKCRFGINSSEWTREGSFTRSKALVLRRCSGPETYRTTGLYILAEDPQGWLVPVLVQNASIQYERLLQPETIFLIKEPWIKPTRDDYIVRVETPTDIYRWPIAFSHPPTFRSYRTAAEYKRIGSQYFIEGRYAQALDAYQAGIYHRWRSERSEQVEIALLHLNAAAAALKVQLPGLALRELDALDVQHLTPVQKGKASYRRAVALYRTGEYAKTIDVLGGGEQTEDGVGLLHRARRRLEEQKNGAYDWPDLHRQAQAGTSEIDIADYVGPLIPSISSGKGKGLFATRTIEPGELLLVSKPLASTKPNSKLMNVVLGLNLASNSLDTYTQVSIPGLLAYKCLYDDNLPSNLDELYAGPQEAKKSHRIPSVTNPWLDVGRTEGVCTYNSFRPVCMTQMYQAEREIPSLSERNDHLHSASALYYLPSFMNHACVGNACYSFFGDIFVLRALKRIEAGEEILDSYCNAMDPLPKRTEHLGRYGFTCRCSLCDNDRAEGEDALRRRSAMLKRMSSISGPRTSKALASMIEEINKTYRSSRSGPRPDLYTCHRALAAVHTDSDEALEAELKALEALGVGFALPRPAKLSSQVDLSLSSLPSLGLQDAIHSYLKIANDSFQAGFVDGAESWLQEAMKLHAIVYGPGLFELHMKPLIKAQGWSALLDI